MRRVVDVSLDDLLPHLGARLIDGPKGVGKTATATARSATVRRLDTAQDAHLLDANPTPSRRTPLRSDRGGLAAEAKLTASVDRVRQLSSSVWAYRIATNSSTTVSTADSTAATSLSACGRTESSVTRAATSPRRAFIRTSPS